MVSLRQRSLRVAFAVIACTAAVQRPTPAQSGSSASASAIKIPFETYTLPNGLTVILAPDHTTPTVAVDVWYHVGSKNETVAAPASRICSST